MSHNTNFMAPSVEELARQAGVPAARRHIFLCCDQSSPKCCTKADGLEAWDFLKRRLRELARLDLATAAKPGHDYVLIGRQPSFDRAFTDLRNDLASALKRLHRTARPPADKGTS